MKTYCSDAARTFPRWLLSIPLLFSAAAAALPLPASAADAIPVVVRVEEDWELVVGSPDPTTTAPQVTCAIFPTERNDLLCATFELNHQTQPDFTSGGIQLQIWGGETLQDARRFPRDGIMTAVGERVTWTQTMTLQDGYLVFEIVNGNSTTWGLFGGQGYLRSASPSDLPSLNRYNPQLSVLNSGVGYAANRVQSLQLKEVRLITSTGEVLRDTTVRTVYPQN